MGAETGKARRWRSVLDESDGLGMMSEVVATTCLKVRVPQAQCNNGQYVMYQEMLGQESKTGHHYYAASRSSARVFMLNTVVKHSDCEIKNLMPHGKWSLVAASHSDRLTRNPTG